MPRTRRSAAGGPARVDLRRAVGAALAAAVAGTLLAGAPGTARADPAAEPTVRPTSGPTARAISAPRVRPASGPIRWVPCPADGSAECGTLSLPVDWADPAGRRFDLALARRPATDPAARVGVLFFGPGGPGDSGLQKVVESVRFSAELRSRFDIVSFDPRGVGRSNPVVCASDLLARVPQVITDQAQFDATVRDNAALRADCRDRTGPVFDHLDTLSAVRDLDAVRAALGEDRLTFHGSSYGTLLGAQYADEYPHRVRAMVLESAIDHSLPMRPFLASQAAAAQDSFDEFVAWCDRSADCVLHGQDVRARWADLLDHAERGELPDPTRPGATLTPFALSARAQRDLYGPDWAVLADRIAAWTAATGTIGTDSGAAATSAAGEQANPLAIFCQDWSLPVNNFAEYTHHLRRLAAIAPDVRYPLVVQALALCLGTPVGNPQRRLRGRTDVPVLVAATRHDPVSEYARAAAVTRQLHGVLLAYVGWGHGSYTTSPCVGTTVDRYLVALAVPATGTRCPAVEPAAAPVPVIKRFASSRRSTLTLSS
ncbi:MULTISPECIES: alpha/beta fold hydrolase [unclassified Micromonospora]|uniref:alpha/beta fold hydrolase n=1 Tax=unclassified Micromonospora TaxID=2617518 RepID=UPI0036327498